MQLELLGDIATWVGSLGTLAAFAVAFIQIHRERTERHRRERREWLLQKRAHVDRVSAWVKDGELHLVNGSRHPLHDIEAVLPGGERIAVDHVAPGDTHMPAPDQADGAIANLEFTDVRGDRWSRPKGGEPRLLSGPEMRGRADARSAT